MHSHHGLPFAVLALATTVPAQAPLQWRQLTHTVPPTAAAWDSTRQATTLLCREGTFHHIVWDGAGTAERLHALDGTGAVWLGDDPLRRELIAMAYSPVRIGRFDGARWTFVTPPDAPALDGLCRPTFDAHRGRIVVFEGAGTQTAVHEWDGTAWWSTPVTLGPGPRDGAAFAFDPPSQRCVLYGGTTLGTPLADCWSWDGSAWTQFAANAPPGPRSDASLAVAPNGRLLLYGGSSATTTWQLVGALWTPAPTAHDPGPRTGATLVRDPLGLLLLGGSDPSGTAWRFTGSDWIATSTTFLAPAVQQGVATAYDYSRGQVVVTGGATLNPMPTWLHDTTWRRTSPTASPPPRNGAQMCWSPADQSVLMFGGIDAANIELSDTWIWTGTDWLQRTPSNTPLGRHGARMAEDALGTVMLFGGIRGPLSLLDQWRWDGTDWYLQTPANQPVVSPASSICFDVARARTVLLSLQAPNILTHEWDGAAWTLAATTPMSQVGWAVAPIGFDPKRGAVIMNGFQWNGVAWTPFVASTPSGQADVLVPDFARQRLLRIQPGSPLLVAEATDHAADATVFGTGCALGPSPALAAITHPVSGNAAFAIDLATLAPALPTFLVLGLGEQFQALGSGCVSLVAAPLDTRFALAGPSAAVRHVVPIPNAPALRGVQIVAQGAVWEPGRSLLGTVTLTAGLRVAIGE